MKSDLTGIFGKLPAHGDFLHRNLPSKAVNEWDAWLQTFVGSTQERLGDAWLDIYLTSPIWRFCLSSGVMDDNHWAGIVLPSVDRVGRYFPFSIMRRLDAATVPCEFVVKQAAWYDALETAALRALDGQLQVDSLLDEVSVLKLALYNDDYVRQSRANLDAGVVVDTDYQAESALGAMPQLLDAFVSQTFSSYGVWCTHGSERVEPCVFICRSMPPVGGAAAMLDGLWEHWDWSVPVRPLSSLQAQQTNHNSVE